MIVSVVVPTRDRPHALKVALAAIGRQTHREMQLIIVDDGSTPENAKLNKEQARAIDPLATCLYLPSPDSHGSGPSYARNAGIAAAKGDLVAFCDDDDYWCDDRHAETAVQAFSADASLDLMFANQEAREGALTAYSIWLPRLVERLSPAQRESDCGARVSRDDCLMDEHAHLNTCMFRRDHLLRIGGFWDGLRYLEDMDIFVRAVDSARRVAYRHRTVSIHNVPDRSLRLNASAQLDDAGKQLVRVIVSNHLIHSCCSSEALRFANRTGGNAYRSLALDASQRDANGAAFVYAKLGLTWRPTLKWCAYTIFLGCKSLFSRSAAG